MVEMTENILNLRDFQNHLTFSDHKSVKNSTFSMCYINLFMIL